MRNADFGGPLHEAVGDVVLVQVVGLPDAAAMMRGKGQQGDADDVGPLTQVNRHAIVQSRVEQGARAYERRHVSVGRRWGGE